MISTHHTGSARCRSWAGQLLAAKGLKVVVNSFAIQHDPLWAIQVVDTAGMTGRYSCEPRRFWLPRYLPPTLAHALVDIVEAIVVQQAKGAGGDQWAVEIIFARVPPNHQVIGFGQ